MMKKRPESEPRAIWPRQLIRALVPLRIQRKFKAAGLGVWIGVGGWKKWETGDRFDRNQDTQYMAGAKR